MLDLVECAALIGNDDAEAAARFLDAADRTFHRICSMPHIGRAWESGLPSLAGVRKWPVRGFRNHFVFYRPVPGGIDVLRVVHAARDLAVVLVD